MKKPNIQEVFDAIQTFQIEQLQIVRKISPGGKKAFAEARNRLKEKLESLGIAKYIDWSEKEN